MNNFVQKSVKFVQKNASTILTCAGAAGAIATPIMAVKATPKAMRLIEEAKVEKGEELTKLETIQVAGLVYIPTVLVGVSTLACIFGANMLNKRQQASLISAYTLLDNSYREYREKVNELYGEDADREVQNEIVKDKYDEYEIADLNGKQLYYDMFSERYFEATPEQVLSAEYEINKKISTWGGAELNEFYIALDIPPVDYGNYLGWSVGTLMDMSWESWLDFDKEKVVMDDGLECTVIRMNVEPMFDYEYY